MVGWDGGLNVDVAKRARKSYSDVIALVETSQGPRERPLHYLNGKSVKTDQLEEAASLRILFVYFGERPVEVKIVGNVLNGSRTVPATLAHPYRDDPYTL